MKSLNYLICNLIGAIEILEVAYLKGDIKNSMLAIKKIIELKNELREHEHVDKDSGHDVWYE